MILLVAYGNNAYAKFASNLAHSLKNFCNYEITLASDGCHEGIDMSAIDKIIPFNPQNYNNDPCLIKINLDKISPYRKTIYLDVDMLCINNPTSLFERIKQESFWIDCLRQTNENWWMRSDKMKKYGCKDIFNDVNSSIMVFEKNTTYFERLNRLYQIIEKRDLKNCWGKRRLIPDEVLHSCLLQNEIESLKPVLYCDSAIHAKYEVFISMYGFGIAKLHVKDLYERTMKGIKSEYYKLNTLYKHKFVGK